MYNIILLGVHAAQLHHMHMCFLLWLKVGSQIDTPGFTLEHDMNLLV
jgi:hypothetical protein